MVKSATILLKVVQSCRFVYIAIVTETMVFLFAYLPTRPPGLVQNFPGCMRIYRPALNQSNFSTKSRKLVPYSRISVLMSYEKQTRLINGKQQTEIQFNAILQKKVKTKICQRY